MIALPLRHLRVLPNAALLRMCLTPHCRALAEPALQHASSPHSSSASVIPALEPVSGEASLRVGDYPVITFCHIAGQKSK